MAGASVDSYIRKQLGIGDRIARQAAKINQKVRIQAPTRPSTGPSFASQVAAAIKRPGVTAVGRPKTAEGGTTFHFSITPVTKGSAATALAGGTARPGAAAAHQQYVEREGAAEHAPGISDEKLESLAAEQQAYLERTEAVENQHALASFGNISNFYEERLQFWRAVEEAEPSPKNHVIILDPSLDPDFWKAVDTPSLNAPSRIVSVARDEITRMSVDDPTAVLILNFAKAHSTRMEGKKPAIDIEIGRGGRIQTRLIAELPHELDADTRIKIAKDFCETQIANLDIQKPNKKPNKTKETLRYWAVIHAPDSHNDSRNNHLHVVFYERPTDRIPHPKTGVECWDFEPIYAKRSPKNRTLYTARHDQQNRNRDINNKSWSSDSRKYFAKLVNAALKDAGVSRRFDPRTYEQMGIEETPIPRIGPKAYQKEKRGIPTPAGDNTVAAQWDREQGRLAALYDTVIFDKAVIDRFSKTIGDFKKKLGSDYVQVEIQLGQWTKAFETKRNLLAERAAIIFNYAKVRSQLTPPLDPRPKDKILEVKTLLDDMQKESLAPLNREYRQALAQEKHALNALAKLETTGPTTLAPPKIDLSVQPQPPKPTIAVRVPPISRPPAAPHITAQKSVNPAAPSIVTPPLIKPSPIAPPIIPPVMPPVAPKMAAPKTAPIKPVTPIPSPAPAATAENKPRTAGISGNIYIPKLSGNLPKRPPIKPIETPDSTIQAQREAPPPPPPSAWKKAIMEGIANAGKMLMDGIDPEAVIQGLAMANDGKQKAADELEVKILAEQNAVDAYIRQGVVLPDTPDVPKAVKDMIAWRRRVVAQEDAQKAATEAVVPAPVQAPVQTPVPAPPQPEIISPVLRPTPPAPPIETISTTPPSRVTPPAAPSITPRPDAPMRSEPSTPIAPRPPFVRKVVPAPAPVSREREISRPISPAEEPAPPKPTLETKPPVAPPVRPVMPPEPERPLYRRRVRQLTEDEKNERAFPHVDMPAPKTPQPPASVRREPLHATDPFASNPFESQIPVASRPVAPVHESTNTRTAKTTSIDPPGAPHAIVTRRPMTPIDAPAPAPVKKTETPAQTVKPTIEAKPAEPGPIIEIKNETDPKKRKKKKYSELTPEERRRILIAQQKSRPGRTR